MKALWDQHSAAPTDDTRNALVEAYQWLVEQIAETQHRRLAYQPDVQDLFCNGIFGLIEAINGFDPTRGVKFETFSPRRIAGAMLDAIRNEDWVPRVARIRSRAHDDYRERVFKETGRPPTEHEVMQHLSTDEAAYASQQLRGDYVVPGSKSMSSELANESGYRSVEMRHVVPGGEDTLADVPMREAMRHLLEQTHGTERAVVYFRIIHGRSLEDVARVLGVSNTRVCNIHRELIERVEADLVAGNRPESLGSPKSVVYAKNFRRTRRNHRPTPTKDADED